MRVLLSTYGSRGDVEPVAALAAELQAQGATARVCAPPDDEFATMLEGLGVEMVPTGMSARERVARMRPGSVPDAREIAADLVSMRFGLLQTASDCDALLATGLPPAGAREVAEHLGIPYVYAAFAPGTLRSPLHRPLPMPGRPYPADETDNRVLWAIYEENLAALYGEPLNARRAEMGLAPVERVYDHICTDHPWLASDPVLAPWPATPGVDVAQTGAWLLPDERPLPPDLEAFLDAGAPPVYIGFGSMPAHVVPGAAGAAVAAAREHGRRVLISRGWADLAADGDAFIVGEVNHRALFARVAAVVHHGGAGTTSTAARAGAPQVVLAPIGDQPYWAGRVESLGIGVAHEEQATTESMSAALATALDPRTRERAAEVAGRMRTDGAAIAARRIIEGRW